MKSAVKLLITVLILSSQSVHSNFNIPLPFGTHERIIKVRDLPNTPQFQLKDGTYYDIGSMYEIKHVFGLSYSNSKAHYVGYIGSQEKYVEILPEDLNAIIARTRILIPEKARIAVFDRFISKPILFIMIIALVYFSRKYFLAYRMKMMKNEEEDILTWPPKQIHE